MQALAVQAEEVMLAAVQTFAGLPAASPSLPFACLLARGISCCGLAPLVLVLQAA